MDFGIRKAVPKDALSIAIVSVYTCKTAYSGLIPDEILDKRIKNLPQNAERMKDWIETNDNFLVATVKDTIVAFCTYLPSRNEDYSGCGEIEALYCLEGYQGYGIGKVLFKKATEALSAMGFDAMILNCLRGNPALGFYEHMGGSIIGEREDISGNVTLVEDILYYNFKSQSK